MKFPKVKSETRIVCDNCDKVCNYPPTNFSLPDDWSRFRYNDEGRLIHIKYPGKYDCLDSCIHLCDICSTVRDILT